MVGETDLVSEPIHIVTGQIHSLSWPEQLLFSQMQAPLSGSEGIEVGKSHGTKKWTRSRLGSAELMEHCY